MTALVLVVAGGGLAYLVGKAWTILIPVAIGAIIAGAFVLAGAPLNDTPIPFASAVATIAAAIGLVIRRQRVCLSTRS